MTVEDLIGEDAVEQWGFVPDRGIVHVPQVTIGDGLAGPENDQPLQIFRDTTPIATDELGFGHLGKVARHRAGRTFPLNDDFDSGIDHTLPGRAPQQDVLVPSVFGPGQDPRYHLGVPAPEITRNPHTVFYTANPAVGWEGW